MLREIARSLARDWIRTEQRPQFQAGGRPRPHGAGVTRAPREMRLGARTLNAKALVNDLMHDQGSPSCEEDGWGSAVGSADSFGGGTDILRATV